MNLSRSANPAVPRRYSNRRRLHKSSMEAGDLSAPLQPMLYLAPLVSAEKRLQFHTFDAAYIARLRTGDLPTQDHFVAYFTVLLHIKLRSRLRSPQAVEDVSQETFARAFALLGKEGALRRPEALGAFLNSVCNNVLLEHYRQSSRTSPLEEEVQAELPAPEIDMVGMVAAGQLKAKVREILQEMPPRDRSLLKAVYLDEDDRDQVCREFGVDREYLRVLLFRAKQAFKTEYLKRAGTGFYAGKA